MGVKEDEFMLKLQATFRIEADEHLQTLSDGLLALEKTPPEAQRAQLVERIFRESHSLKGASRSVNQWAIQEICQALENVLSAWHQGTLKPSKNLFDTLYATLDTIKQALSAPLNKEVISATSASLSHLLENTEKIAEKVEANPSPPPEEKTLKDVLPQMEQLIQRDMPQKVAEAPSDMYRAKTIRISLSKLDLVFQEAEEMLMVKLISQKAVNDLKEILYDFRSKEKELVNLLSETQTYQHLSQTDQSCVTDWKPHKKIIDYLDKQQRGLKTLRETIERLSKTSEQNAHFVSSLVDSLLEDVKKILTQPMATLMETIPRMVRDLARDLGKEVRFESAGGDIEVDKRILEEIKDPVIHLIRNAIDHGIEDPVERAKKGKPTEGLIRIVATETGGGNVELSLSDDGRGFDVDALKRAALNQSTATAKEIEEMTTKEVMKLAFQSGVSTSSTITELSGRGLGLGIVSEKAEKLGGHVLVESVPNEGTTFRLVLPVTLATFRGIHLSVGGQDFIMPTHNVVRVMRLKRQDIRTIENLEAIIVDGKPMSFVHLASVLGLTQPQVEANPDDVLFALLIKSEGKTIAFAVDTILREQEVLVKGLGKLCTRVRNVMAATILESGEVIPVLNPTDLVRSAVKGDSARPSQKRSPLQTSATKHILVTEDSITTRLLLKNILESAGYTVSTATDGLEALQVLQAGDIDMVLTDVEMPNMDGFTLTARIRSNDATKDIPVVICTSRGSTEDRERGIEIGADAYIDKSSFSQSTLLNTAKKLL